MARGEVTAMAEDLQDTVGALVRRMRSASPARDLTLSQVSVLKRLDRDGPRGVADLARLDKITHQSIAATVATLVERGLVLRMPDPADLRRKQLMLTDHGRAMLRERRAAGQGELAAVIADRLSPAECAHLAGALPLLRRLID